MTFLGITFAVLGGDLRQMKLISSLADDGYKVKVFGFSNVEFPHNVEVCQYVEEAIENADIIICPIPCSQDNKTLFAKYNEKPINLKDIFKQMPKDKVVMGGMVTDEIEMLCRKYGIKVVDLLERNELAILNAIPTAEGAIQIAMENSNITIHGSKCLVLGYGRCGKVLAHMLKGIGAKVTVEARKPDDLAYITAYDYEPLHINNMEEKLGEYDFIFNTIPSLILDKDMLQKIKQSCIIIDLASAPGGVDFKVAEELGIKAMLCLSLPGKVAPKTAAQIIKDTVFNIVSEMGVIL